jgi:sec-independent protein translocase protein TatA
MKLIEACDRVQSMHTIALVTPGPTEWVLILVIVLVLFGAKKLPELARSLGQSMNEFRKAREEFDKELHQAGQDLKGSPQNTQQYQPGQPAQPIPPAQPAAVQAQAQPPTQPPSQPS